MEVWVKYPIIVVPKLHNTLKKIKTRIIKINFATMLFEFVKLVSALPFSWLLKSFIFDSLSIFFKCIIRQTIRWNFHFCQNQETLLYGCRHQEFYRHNVLLFVTSKSEIIKRRWRSALLNDQNCFFNSRFLLNWETRKK